jgi:hypothetical protein
LACELTSFFLALFVFPPCILFRFSACFPPCAPSRTHPQLYTYSSSFLLVRTPQMRAEAASQRRIGRRLRLAVLRETVESQLLHGRVRRARLRVYEEFRAEFDLLRPAGMRHQIFCTFVFFVIFSLTHVTRICEAKLRGRENNHSDSDSRAPLSSRLLIQSSAPNQFQKV